MSRSSSVPPGLLDLAREHVPQVEHGAGPAHRPACLGVVLPHGEIERALPGLLLLRGEQLPVQVPHRQVGEIVTALVGTHEIGRQRRVAREARHRPAALAQHAHLRLRVVEDLGARGVAEPRPHRRLGGRVEVGEGDERDRAASVRRTVVGDDTPLRHAAARGEGEALRVPLPLGPGAEDGDADRHAGRGVSLEPPRHLGGLQHDPVHLERLTGRLLRRRLERGEQPVAQHPELEAVEHAVHLVTVPGGPLEIVEGDRQGDVTDERVESPVAQHTVEVRAQVLPRLALDRGDVGHDAREVAVQPEPLGRRLGTHTGDPGQVVRGLPHHRGQVRVPLGPHAVARLDGVGRHAGELGDALDRVEHRRGVGDELERVAVAGDDEHLVERGALGPRLVRPGGEGGDDVVGLVTVHLDVADAQRVEHLLEQRDLPAELVRRGTAGGLVLGVLLRAEGLARDVERHGEMCGVLVAQDVDEHRREPVDRVRRLPRRRGEVLRRQGEERTVGEGVPVEKEESAHGCEPRRPHRQPSDPVAPRLRVSTRRHDTRRHPEPAPPPRPTNHAR